MKSTIFKITFIGLLSASLFGCGDSNDKKNPSNKNLTGTCKELFDARIEEYNKSPELTEEFTKKTGISKEKMEDGVKESYLDMTEEECKAEKNYSEDNSDL